MNDAKAAGDAAQASDTTDLLASLTLEEPSISDNSKEETTPPDESEVDKVDEESTEKKVESEDAPADDKKEDKDVDGPDDKSDKVEEKAVESSKKEDKQVDAEATDEADDKPEMVLKQNYDELRSFSDRTINKLTDEVKKLKETLKSKPEPTSSTEYVELAEKNETLSKDNKILTAILTKVQKEYDLNLEEFAPKEKPQSLTKDDLREIIKEQMSAQEKVVDKKEEDDPVKMAVIDFMGRQGLLESSGRVGQKGKTFLGELDKLGPPSDKVNSELIEKMIMAKNTLAPKKETKVVDNKVKEGLAKAASSLGAPGNSSVKKAQGNDPLDDLMGQVGFLST